MFSHTFFSPNKAYLSLLLKQHLKKDIGLPSLIQIRQKNKGKPRVKERTETVKKVQALKSKPK